MDILNSLLYGFSIALAPSALIYCFAGVAFGTALGVLPGIGALTGISLLMPVTFYLNPVHGLIMLSGIYYGVQYGSSTAAILLNLPGTPSSAVTCLDGYPLARQGKAGLALVITTLASLVGGVVAVLIVALFAPPLARAAIQLSAPEYFSAMIMAVLAVASLTQGSLVKGLGMLVLGALLATVGTDLNSGARRLTFGIPDLADGFSIVVISMALFGVTEVVANLTSQDGGGQVNTRLRWRDLIPSRSDLKASGGAIGRGTFVGSLIGVIPGLGPTVSSFLSYAVEKQVAKDPSRFGHGALEGVAGPEAANNASAQTGFIPMLTLGIPGDVTTALLLGALLVHGIAPGPQVISSHPDLFWGLIASFLIGNAMLFILNVPLVHIWVWLLSIPYRLLYPAIMLLVCIGVLAIRNSPFDVLVTGFFGFVGYILHRLRCEPAPLVLGFVLAPMIEENLRRSLLMSRGDPSIFVTRPISLVLLLLGFGFLIYVAFRQNQRRKAMRAGLPANANPQETERQA